MKPVVNTAFPVIERAFPVAVWFIPTGPSIRVTPRLATFDTFAKTVGVVNMFDIKTFPLTVSVAPVIDPIIRFDVTVICTMFESPGEVNVPV